MKRNDTEAQLRLIALKIQTFEFSIPLYCFVMIAVTLDFSAISFYLNLRDLLYPKIKENDLANIKWHEKIKLDTRFFSIIGVISLFLIIYSVIILSQKEPENGGVLFTTVEKIFVYTSAGILYTF